MTKALRLPVAMDAHARLARAWDALGLAPGEQLERAARFDAALAAFVDAFVAEEQKAVDALAGDVEAARKRNVELEEALGLEHADVEGKNLRETLSNLEEKRAELEEEKQLRKSDLEKIFKEMSKLLQYMPQEETSMFPFPDLDNVKLEAIEESKIISNNLEECYNKHMEEVNLYLNNLLELFETLGVDSGDDLADSLGISKDDELSIGNELKRSDVVNYSSLILSKHLDVFHPCDLSLLKVLRERSNVLVEQCHSRSNELRETIERLILQISSGELVDDDEKSLITNAEQLLEKTYDRHTIKIIKDLEETSEKLEKVRLSKLPNVISSSRKELENLWNMLLLTPTELEVRRGKCPGIDEITEEALTELESLILDAKHELEQKQAIIDLIKLREELHSEQKELDEAAKDPQRLTGRARGMAAKLIEEAKTRHKIQVQLPKTLKKLLAAIEKWENEKGRPWTDDENESQKFKEGLVQEMDSLVIHSKTKVPTVGSKKADGRPSSSASSSSRSRERNDSTSAVPKPTITGAGSNVPIGRKRPSSSHSNK